MLRRLSSCLLLGLLGNVVPASALAAGVPVTCPSGQAWNALLRTCVIVVTKPEDPGSDGGISGGTADDGGRGASPAAVRKCIDELWSEVPPTEVPCTSTSSRYGVPTHWSNDRDCYVGRVEPQPPRDDPRWSGNAEGAIYFCEPPDITTGLGQVVVEFWALTSPAGPAAAPDPKELAEQAIALMELRAVDIGIVPEDLPGRVGVIGMPTWMWAEDPGENTLGPITRTASAGGFSVTATAEVAKVVWSMGDGASVTCTGPGTRYVDAYEAQDSPTCGHTYSRDGRHTVTATSYWTVEWEGIGQSGTIPLEFSDSTSITMGEVQVITQ